jgi:hypothetical protein
MRKRATSMTNTTKQPDVLIIGGEVPGGRGIHGGNQGPPHAWEAGSVYWYATQASKPPRHVFLSLFDHYTDQFHESYIWGYPKS